jgi:hypothetical protein
VESKAKQPHIAQNDRTVVDVEEAIMTCIMSVFTWKNHGNLEIPNDGEPRDQVSMSGSLKYEAEVPHSTFIRSFISGSTVLFWAPSAFQLRIPHTHSEGIVGRGITPSQGRYLHTRQHQHIINALKYPCLKWDSNPRPQGSSGRKLHASDRAAAVIGPPAR